MRGRGTIQYYVWCPYNNVSASSEWWRMEIAVGTAFVVLSGCRFLFARRSTRLAAGTVACYVPFMSPATVMVLGACLVCEWKRRQRPERQEK